MKAKGKWIFTCLGISFLALVIQADLGIGAGGSQYLTHGRNNFGGQAEIKIFNTSPVEMFVLYLKYDEDFDFNSCDSDLFPRSSSSFEDASGGPGHLCCVDGRTYNEIIAVPTLPPFRGVINPRFGVMATMGSGDRDGNPSAPGPMFVPEDPKRFKVLDGAAKSCACSALSGFGLPATLLRGFGIVCP